MADYPILAATLAAMGGTKNDPAGTEVSSKIDDALRQTRNWVFDYLSVYFDANGLKSTAFGTNTLATGFVRGTNPADFSPTGQREILQASVTHLDLRDDAVITAKIAALAVTAAKIANGTITATQLADLAVTAAKIADLTIVAGKIANGAISTDKLADLAVTAAKFADATITAAKIAQNAIAGDRLVLVPAGYMLVGGNVVNGVSGCAAPKEITGAIKIDANGVTTLQGAAGGMSFVHIVERANTNVAGGTATATTWNQRGANPANPWNIIEDTLGNTVAISGEKILVKQNGTYLVQVSSPATGTADRHRIRATIKADGNSGTIITRYGTNENTVANVSTRSTLNFIQTFVNATDPTFPYFSIEHWVAVTQATNGLGIAANIAGLSEEYATVQLVKLA